MLFVPSRPILQRPTLAATRLDEGEDSHSLVE